MRSGGFGRYSNGKRIFGLGNLLVFRIPFIFQYPYQANSEGEASCSVSASPKRHAVGF
jgi:hypothetical protein